jgi:hypothetical protein
MESIALEPLGAKPVGLHAVRLRAFGLEAVAVGWGELIHAASRSMLRADPCCELIRGAIPAALLVLP